MEFSRPEESGVCIEKDESEKPTMKNALPGKIFIQIWRWEQGFFLTNKQKLEEFSAMKSALQEILKELVP